MKITTTEAFTDLLAQYPEHIKPLMENLRSIVRSVAEEQDIEHLEETTKWGEPSFISPHGSTLRMDWKEKSPDQYCLYFQCSSRLVETFKMVYADGLKYEGSRAVVFSLQETLPVETIKSCIAATLNYHRVKKLPLLGL